MNINISKYWKNKPKEETKKALSKGLTIIFALEFMTVLAIFICLDHYDHLWASIFLFLTYGYALKGSVDLLEQNMEDTLMKEVYGENNEEDTSKPAEDVDSSETSTNQDNT